MVCFPVEERQDDSPSIMTASSLLPDNDADGPGFGSCKTDETPRVIGMYYRPHQILVATFVPSYNGKLHSLLSYPLFRFLT